MMRKKCNPLLVLIFSFLILSCNQKEDLNDARVLKEKIQSSQDFKNYKNSILQLTESTIKGEISITNADKEMLRQASKKSKSVQEFTKYCEDSGMKGAKKFAELLFMQNQSSINIFKKYPQLKKLSRNELDDIFELDIKPGLTENTLNK